MGHEEESKLYLRSEKKRRDDFTWMLLLFESIRNHRKKIPLMNQHKSYYRGSNTFPSQGFRFSDEKRAEEEERERKRRRLAYELDLAYVILMIVITLVLAILVH